jgi:type II secretory pathway pseudopilin PulG
MKYLRRLLSLTASRRAGRPRPAAAESNMAGFTIIEILIVLGIAGLILLIVFEALPALERNSRNSQRRQDVQTILAAVSHYELNDSGNFPYDCNGSPNACTDTGGPTSNDYFLQPPVQSRLVYYTGSTQVVLAHQTPPGPTFAPSTDTETVDVYNYEKCDPNDGGSSGQGAGYSDVVALYAIESGNGSGSQCQQL